ncbi:MAG: hypothetical protein RSC43_00295 [Clostridia bacterium]
MIEFTYKIPSNPRAPYVSRMDEISECKVKMWVMNTLGVEVPFTLYIHTPNIMITMDTSYAESISDQFKFVKGSLMNVTWPPLSTKDFPLAIEEQKVYFAVNDVPHSADFEDYPRAKLTYRVGNTSLLIVLDYSRDIESITATCIAQQDAPQAVPEHRFAFGVEARTSRF